MISPLKWANVNPQEIEQLKALGANIRRWRERRELTQDQFAPMVGFTRSYITAIETGKGNISFLNLMKIIQVLEVSEEDSKTLIFETKESGALL